jgi:phospholipid transport system substrate-binding protein
MAFILAVLASLMVVSAVAHPVQAAEPRRPDRTGGAAAVPEVLRQTPTGASRASADDVRGQVEAAFRALVDAGAARDRGATTASQREAIRKAGDKIFDWGEMAEEALGQHWARMNRPERDRFTRLLSQIFERLCLPIIERTGDPKAAGIGRSVVFVGETVKGDGAVVRTIWKRSARHVTVDWSLRRKARAWRIHDVALEGISVVDNYRAQFDRIIQRSSYEDLVARMEAKVSSPSPTGDPPAASTLSTKPRPELSAGDLP